MTYLSLKEAQRLILKLANPTQAETVPLDKALDRIAAEDLKALIAVPSFAHSTRDGYAVRKSDLQKAGDKSPVYLEVQGEIPAGCTDIPRLEKGTALRIMTGAAVPDGCDLIIPQEEIRQEEGKIIVADPPSGQSHIRKKGSALAKGSTVTGKGSFLTPEDLALLTTAGVNVVKVHRKPSAAVICTGSELVAPGNSPIPGQVISGNRLLLDGLLRKSGAVIDSLDTVIDRVEKIAGKLDRLVERKVPLIITTGGMGPGKFDLMDQVFSKLGIDHIYDSIKVKPGRATMLGSSGDSMIFALPGPPPAVKLLFNELVKPALLKISGRKGPFIKVLKAELMASVDLKQGRSMQLREGYFSFEKDRVKVVPANKKAGSNCILILPSGRNRIKKGEIVTIHPTIQLF